MSKKIKKARPGQKIDPPKATELRYRKQLMSIVNRIDRLIKIKLIPAIKKLEPEYTADSKESARKQLISILNLLNKQLTPSGKDSLKWSESFVNGTDKINERRNFEMFKRVSGVDLKRVIMNEGIDKEIKGDIALNIKLIKSIPGEYFQRLNKIFEESLLKGKSADSLIEQITELSGSTKKRAEFIARDQTATISGKLNERRSANLGSVGYKWLNSGDRRVRGNPGGIYPNAPSNHWNRNGKYYLWVNSSKKIKAPNGKPFNRPPTDGNPGQPIGCRCTAIPIIPIG